MSREEILEEIKGYIINAISGYGEINSQNIDISIELLKSYKTIRELPPTLTIDRQQ